MDLFGALENVPSMPQIKPAATSEQMKQTERFLEACLGHIQGSGCDAICGALQRNFEPILSQHKLSASFSRSSVRDLFDELAQCARETIQPLEDYIAAPFEGSNQTAQDVDYWESYSEFHSVIGTSGFTNFFDNLLESVFTAVGIDLESSTKDSARMVNVITSVTVDVYGRVPTHLKDWMDREFLNLTDIVLN